MADSQTARIPASVETRDALKARKRGDETYDDVLQRLLNGEGRAVYEIGSEDPVDFLEGAEIGHDASELATSVAEQFDYTAIAHRTADEVVERLRSEMG